MTWHSSKWLLRKLMQSKSDKDDSNEDDNDSSVKTTTIADDDDNDQVTTTDAIDDVTTSVKSNLDKGKEQIEMVSNAINEYSKKMNSMCFIYFKNSSIILSSIVRLSVLYGSASKLVRFRLCKQLSKYIDC